MLAFATDYNGESKDVRELEKNLAELAEAGFSHVHWCHEWGTDDLYTTAEMLQIRSWIRKYGLGVKGIHGAEGLYEGDPTKYRRRCELQNRRSYSSQNEFNRLAGVELIENRVRMASILDAHEVVLHMQLPYEMFEEDESFRTRYFDQVCRSFDQLEPVCIAYDVRLCLENCLGTPAKHQLYEFDLMFSRYSSDFLGFCFDTGHANICCGDDPLLFARRYQDRLIFTHLCDNHGLQSPDCWTDGRKMGRCDEHLLPFEALFDWEGYAKVLAGSPIEEPLVIEPAFKGGDRTAYLHRAVKAGETFTAMVEKYRAGK